MKKERTKARIELGAMLIGIIAVITVAVVLICRGFPHEDITGNWNIDGTTEYRFHEDGSGSLILPNGIYRFTYTVDGDTVFVDYDDEAAEDTSYSWHVSGDVLTLKKTDSPGTVYKLNRIEETGR